MRVDPAKLKAARERRGMSRKMLADFAGLSAMTVGRMERDEVDSRPVTLRYVADALRVRVTDLLPAGSTLPALPSSSAAPDGRPRLRVGRKVGRTLYLQAGNEPSDDDRLVGMVDTTKLATALVDAWNRA